MGARKRERDTYTCRCICCICLCRRCLHTHTHTLCVRIRYTCKRCPVSTRINDGRRNVWINPVAKRADPAGVHGRYTNTYRHIYVMHACIHTYILTYRHTRTNGYTYMYMHMYIWLHMYMCIYTCILGFGTLHVFLHTSLPRSPLRPWEKLRVLYVKHIDGGQRRSAQSWKMEGSPSETVDPAVAHF